MATAAGMAAAGMAAEAATDMPRAYLFVGLMALAVFSWAQYRGVGLFDDAAPSQSRLSPSARSTFHK